MLSMHAENTGRVVRKLIRDSAHSIRNGLAGYARDHAVQIA